MHASVSIILVTVGSVMFDAGLNLSWKASTGVSDVLVSCLSGISRLFAAPNVRQRENSS